MVRRKTQSSAAISPLLVASVESDRAALADTERALTDCESRIAALHAFLDDAAAEAA